MDEIEYKGIKYTRLKDKWTENYIVVQEPLQRILNRIYAEQSMDLSRMTVKQVILEADKFKRSSDFYRAARCYEEVIARGSQYEISSILPRLSSCYRLQGRPQKSVDLMNTYLSKLGSDVINDAMLTSVAAAYCDLGQWEKAKQCLKSVDTHDGETGAVWQRVRAHEL